MCAASNKGAERRGLISERGHVRGYCNAQLLISPVCCYRCCPSAPNCSLNYLFTLFKVKAPDTRSALTWVILQPLTFPSLRQARARTLIDPAHGLAANLPGGGGGTTVFHSSFRRNYPQNKHVLGSGRPSDGRWWEVVCALTHAGVSALIYRSGGGCKQNNTARLPLWVPQGQTPSAQFPPAAILTLISWWVLRLTPVESPVGEVINSRPLWTELCTG